MAEWKALGAGFDFRLEMDENGCADTSNRDT